MRLDGRRIVLTGATGGIGQMIAPALLEAGAKVAIVARSGDALERMCSELNGDVMSIVGDVSEAADNDAIAATVVDKWGGLDVWIANAGISPVVKSAPKMSDADFLNVLNVNLVGAFWGARAALRVMGEGGRVIMTSSVLGQRARRGFSAYVASKAGMEGMVRALALDAAPMGITVNAVAPGWFDSPLAEPWMRDNDLADQILSHVPLKRWGQPSDIAGAYTFLASRESDFVTGSVLAVDGGYLLL
jgi:NAD(P)-dependent dehydrogenase (short-subunit alcohol dehydrogenase family)